MWILFPDVFASVVVHQDSPAKLVVRARLPGDLERLLPGSVIEKTPKADYLYRTTVQREVLAEVLLRRLGSMTYTNVKGAVAKSDHERSAMMSRMWTAGWHAQADADRLPPVIRDLFDDPEDEVDGAYAFDADGQPIDPEEVSRQFDVTEGRKRRDRGMARAEGNTDPEWKAKVRQLCEEFISRPAAAGRVFTAEDLRLWCEEEVPQPHHHNAWSANLGGMIRSWKSTGAIEQVGSQEARRPMAHARLMRCYRVAS